MPFHGLLSRRRWPALLALSIAAAATLALSVRGGEAAQLTAGGFTTSAAASPATAAPSGTTTITASVTSSAASTVLVDIEVYNPAGAKVAQRFFDNEPFTAGQRRDFALAWQVPAGEPLGTHSVRVGIFSPGWGTAYHWNANAATLTVAQGATGTPAPTATAAPAPAGGSRIAWQGKNWYVHGANLPWLNWACDFGCGPNGGASSSASKNTLAPVFQQAKANGINVVRWWVFPGDAWQISRNGSGTPTGLTSAVYTDLDAALALAQTHDLYFNLVLFSGPTHIPSSWLTDATQRQALVSVLSPLFARYKDNPRILSWEIVNEPEFDIWGGKIAQAPVQATVKALTSAVHANSNALVTVGSAHLDGLPMWADAGLDYYSPHWYDYMSPGNWCARCTDYTTVKSRYGVSAPVVIGEMYAGPGTDALQRFEDFYAKGYAGAWAWSLLSDRTSDKMVVDQAASKTFAGRHGDLGPRAGGAAPTPSPSPTPSPTASPTVTATRTPTASPTPTITATPTTAPTQTVTFDDKTGQNQALSGRYPSNLIDWGNGVWYHSGPWGKFTTKSISFSSGSRTSGAFTFITAKRLASVQAYNGGSGATTVTLACAGQPSKTVTLAAGQLTTITTGWTGTCSTVTITSTNGWDTNFDSLVIAG